MGVRYLLKFLAEHADELSCPVRFPDSAKVTTTVLIDGYGFVISLLDAICDEKDRLHLTANSAFRREVAHEVLYDHADVLGNDMFAIAERFDSVVLHLQRQFGWRLIFAIDGPRGIDGPMGQRNAVWRKRQQEAQRTTSHLYKYCAGIVPTKTDNGELPLPALAFTSLFDLLRRRHDDAQLVFLQCEVDDVVNELISTHRADLVLTSDTDVMLTSSVPCMITQQMDVAQLLDTSRDKLTVRTFHRDSLMVLLGLTPTLSSDRHLLFLAASLCGNDITEEFCGTFRLRTSTIRSTLEHVRAATADPQATCFNGEPAIWAQRCQHPVIATSVKWYQSITEATRRSNIGEWPAHLGGSERRLAELSELGVLYTSGRLIGLDTSWLPMALYGWTLPRLPPWPARLIGRGLSTHATAGWFDDALTSVRLRKAERVLLFDCYESTVNHLSWRSLRVSADNIKLRIVDLLFSFHDDQCVEDMNRLFIELQHHPETVFAKRVQFFEAVIWLIHPLVREVDLPSVAGHFMVMAMRDGRDSRWSDLFNHLCGPRSLREGVRPTTQVLDLSYNMQRAYAAVRSWEVLLQGGFSDSCSDADQRLSANAISGTLIHCLTQYENASEWQAKLPQDILSKVQNLVEAVKVRVRGSSNCEPSSTFLPENNNVTSRLSNQWVGVLHRDELIDMMDEGGTIRPGQVRVAASKNSKTSLPCGLVSPHVGELPSQLPIEPHLPTILDAIGRNNVVCIQGETGCGKSSMIPLAIYNAAAGRGCSSDVSIIVTQPRRLAATTLAHRVASLLGEEVGERVGYRVGGGPEFHRESRRTRIRFVTTGYLLEALVNNSRIWETTTHFLLDEVHERSLQADMLSLVLKLLLGEHSNCPDADACSAAVHHEDKKLIVMSATIQADMFCQYFSTLNAGKAIPSLFVGARRCKVDEYFIEEAIERLKPSLPGEVFAELEAYRSDVQSRERSKAALRLDRHISAIVNLVLVCVKEGAAILVFLPGLQEIEDAIDTLQQMKRKYHQNICSLNLIALHSVVELEQQNRAILPAAANECKVVFATNIAETSITIPDVSVVIDCGLSRRMEYDEKRRLRTLVCGWCSRSAAKQRSGRAGRVSSGTVIRLYTRGVYDHAMSDFDASEFLPLEYSVLQVRAHLGAYGQVEAVMAQMIEPPPASAVSLALERLVHWGALGPSPDFEVMELGATALSMPVDVSLTNAILTACAFGCGAEMIVIAAGLTGQRSPIHRPLRTYYETEEEYLKEYFQAMRTLHYFDRGHRSDLHVFLAIYEETAACRSFDQLRMFRDRNRLSLIPRNVLTFHKLVRQIATCLLRTVVGRTSTEHGPRAGSACLSAAASSSNNRCLEQDDLERIRQLAARDVNELCQRRTRLPALTDEIANQAVILVLAQCAEAIFSIVLPHNQFPLTKVASIIRNSTSSWPASSVATPAMRDDIVDLCNTVLFDGLPRHVVDTPPDKLVTLFESCIGATIRRLSVCDSQRAAIITFDTGSHQADPQHRDKLGHCHFALHGLAQLPGMHPMKAIVLPLATGSEPNTTFPSAVAGSTQSARGVACTESTTASSFRAERWSASVGAFGPLRDAADCFMPGVAWSVTAFGPLLSASAACLATTGAAAFAGLMTLSSSVCQAHFRVMNEIRIHAVEEEGACIVVKVNGSVPRVLFPFHALVDVAVVHALTAASKLPTSQRNTAFQQRILELLRDCLRDPVNTPLGGGSVPASVAPRSFTKKDLGIWANAMDRRSITLVVQRRPITAGLSLPLYDLREICENNEGFVPPSKRLLYSRLEDLVASFAL